VKLRRLRAAAIAIALTVAALATGPIVPGAHLGMTDAAFTDSESASASLKATTLPTITFTACSTPQGANTMTLTWHFNSATLPGQSTSWVIDLGLNVVSGATVSTSGPDGSGNYTTTINFTSLSLGTYAAHPTTKLYNWTAASTNHPEATAVTLVLATVWGTCSLVTGA